MQFLKIHGGEPVPCEKADAQLFLGTYQECAEHMKSWLEIFTFRQTPQNRHLFANPECADLVGMSTKLAFPWPSDPKTGHEFVWVFCDAAKRVTTLYRQVEKMILHIVTLPDTVFDASTQDVYFDLFSVLLVNIDEKYVIEYADPFFDPLPKKDSVDAEEYKEYATIIHARQSPCRATVHLFPWGEDSYVGIHESTAYTISSGSLCVGVNKLNALQFWYRCASGTPMDPEFQKSTVDLQTVSMMSFDRQPTSTRRKQLVLRSKLQPDRSVVTFRAKSLCHYGSDVCLAGLQ